MPIAIHTDQQVVAAFNDCLDLAKYRALPVYVRNRFEVLLCKNRVKAVCFMSQLGLGLRVYCDRPMPNCEQGDELVQPLLAHGVSVVDEDGHWLRCPAELFTTPPPPPEKFLIMNERGTQYYSRDTTRDDYEDDGDNDDETVIAVGVGKPRWVASRSNGKRFEARPAAEAKAAEIGGGCVVVRY